MGFCNNFMPRCLYLPIISCPIDGFNNFRGNEKFWGKGNALSIINQCFTSLCSLQRYREAQT